MRFLESELKDVILIEPDVFHDERGLFFESYHAQKYAAGGIPGPFVQDNYSRSGRGTLRGLHYQLRRGQGKLISVLEGVVHDVAVDIRRGSPTFGSWVGFELSADNKRQIYIPPGFAHGFCVLSENAAVVYKCTELYAPDDEGGVIWNDPDMGIIWPITEPRLSPKDQRYCRLAQIPVDRLPVYSSPLSTS